MTEATIESAKETYMADHLANSSVQDLLTSDGDGDLLATVLGDNTTARLEATSDVTPFCCIMDVIFNMPNNSACSNVLGIAWKSVDPESAETSRAVTSSTLRSWSKLAGPSGCAGWSFTIGSVTAGMEWDSSASPAGSASTAGTGRDGSSTPARTASTAGPGRGGTDHPPLLVWHPLLGWLPVKGRHLLDQPMVLGRQTLLALGTRWYLTGSSVVATGRLRMGLGKNPFRDTSGVTGWTVGPLNPAHWAQPVTAVLIPATHCIRADPLDQQSAGTRGVTGRTIDPRSLCLSRDCCADPRNPSYQGKSIESAERWDLGWVLEKTCAGT